MRVLRFIFGLALVIGIAACSQATPTPTPQPTAAPVIEATATPEPATNNASGGTNANHPDPCSLMTVDEATQLLGKPVTRGSDPDPDDCVYQTADANGPKIVFLVTWSGAAADAEGWKQLAGDALKPVPNVGDEAFFTGGGLFVRKGNADFNVITNGNNELPGVGKTNELIAEAAKMAARLP